LASFIEIFPEREGEKNRQKTKHFPTTDAIGSTRSPEKPFDEPDQPAAKHLAPGSCSAEAVMNSRRFMDCPRYFRFSPHGDRMQTLPNPHSCGQSTMFSHEPQRLWSRRQSETFGEVLRITDNIEPTPI
jgi:hypothetical protein